MALYEENLFCTPTFLYTTNLLRTRIGTLSLYVTLLHPIVKLLVVKYLKPTRKCKQRFMLGRKKNKSS